MIGIQFELEQARYKKLTDKLTKFERGFVLGQTLDETAEFMRYRLREYPPYRYVSRKAAYGVSFFTDKQRRWFFAALADGRINPGRSNRSGALGQGWRIVRNGQTQLELVNAVPYAGWVQGDQQARQPKMAGWLSTSTWLREFEGEIGRVGMKNIEKWVDE